MPGFIIPFDPIFPRIPTWTFGLLILSIVVDARRSPLPDDTIIDKSLNGFPESVTLFTR